MSVTLLMPVLAAAFTVFQADPYNVRKYLPDERPDGGVETTCVKSAAAQGEIESALFMVLPAADLTQFHLKSSDLKGPDGATISASAVDLAVVKYWYRPGGRWWSSWFGNAKVREMMGNLVLHDDGIIRLDEEKKITYLRVDYPAPIGTKYLDMTNPGRGEAFNDEIQPLKDAPALVPVAKLTAGRYKPFWLTYRVPAGQKPGVYRGTLAVTAGGKDVGTIALELKVRPFALPEARTHYDTSRPYTLAFYGTPMLGKVLENGKDLARAERKLFNVYRDMAEHNVTTALGPEDDVGDGSAQSIPVRCLMLMRKAGFRLRPLMAAGAQAGDADYVFACKTRDGSFEATRLDAEPEKYAAALAKKRETVARNFACYDRLLGHHDAFIFGFDECEVAMHRVHLGYYAEILKLGGRIYADASDARALSWALSANNISGTVSHSQAWRWHRAGADMFTYAAPFTGPQCPDTWRRQKGLRFYMADFDGVVDYNFTCESPNRWNEFIYRYSHYGPFGFPYLTSDGVIDTVAWNALREGMDDVRYYSLLRLRAEAAMKSSDPAVRRLGREAIVWFDSQDPELILDLDGFRDQVSERIARLIEKVGPETSVLPGSLPVTEIPPADGPKPFADAKAGVALARAYKEANRYDLGIAVAAKVRADAAADYAERTGAALVEAEMLSETGRRDEAVKNLEALAADPTAKRVHRGRLTLAMVRSLLTDFVFEEKYTKDQLDGAEKILKQGLAIAEVPVDERVTAAIGYATACAGSGAGQRAVDFLTPFVSVQAYRRGRGRLATAIGRCYRAMGEYQKATVWIKRSIVEFHGDATLQEFAEVSDLAHDYQTALDAYTRWLPTIDKIYDQGRYHACLNGIKRMTEILKQKQSAAPQKNLLEDGADAEAVSLDED